MSPRWTPNDTFLINKRQAGLKAVNKALKDHKKSLTSGILTSRDARVDHARYDLRKAGMPPGWDTWQLPAYLVDTPTFFFLSACAPGAVLPTHSHTVNQFRIVLSGGMIHNGVELRSGDWMYIPKGEEYSLSASTNPGGCIVAYCY